MTFSMDKMVAACRLGHLEKVKRLAGLVPRDALQRESEFGESPWHEAIVSHNCDLVEFLLGIVEDVNARNPMGQTGLHLACQEGDEAVVWLLLEAGADVDALDMQGRSALHFAVEKEDCLMTALLIDKHAFVGYDDEVVSSPWMRACELGHWDVAKQLLTVCSAEELLDLNPNGLCACVQSGHEEMSIWLAELGYRLDGWNDQGETPLHMAARRNMMGLIKMGAQQQRLGAMTARQDGLMHAATIGSAEMIVLLAECGLPVDSCNMFGCTPASLAFWNKRSDELMALFFMGADPKKMMGASGAWMRVPTDASKRSCMSLVQRAHLIRR